MIARTSATSPGMTIRPRHLRCQRPERTRIWPQNLDRWLRLLRQRWRARWVEQKTANLSAKACRLWVLLYIYVYIYIYIEIVDIQSYTRIDVCMYMYVYIYMYMLCRHIHIHLSRSCPLRIFISIFFCSKLVKLKRCSVCW